MILTASLHASKPLASMGYTASPIEFAATRSIVIRYPLASLQYVHVYLGCYLLSKVMASHNIHMPCDFAGGLTTTSLLCNSQIQSLTRSSTAFAKSFSRHVCRCSRTTLATCLKSTLALCFTCLMSLMSLQSMLTTQLNTWHEHRTCSLARHS